MPSILQAPTISNADSPVINGLMSGVTRIADAMARAKAADAAKQSRAEELAYRADERQYQRGRDAKADQRQHMGDIEAGRVAPASPLPAEMAAADRGQQSRNDVAQKARRAEGAKLWASINDEALRHGRDSGTIRDTDGRQVGYDPRRATQAYAAFWEAQRKSMPKHLRSLVDELGTEQAMQIPGVAKAISSGKQDAEQGQPPADTGLMPGSSPDGNPPYAVSVPSTRPGSNSTPVTKNFGSDAAPDWRQWDNATGQWAPPTMSPGPQPVGDASFRMSQIQQTNPNLHAIMTRSGAFAAPEAAPVADAAPMQDAAPNILTAPATGADPSSVATVSNAMRRGAPPQQPDPTSFQQPGWRDAKIDQGGVNDWHRMAKADPAGFVAQLKALKDAGDPRYKIIADELRARSSGAVSPDYANAQPRSVRAYVPNR